MGKAGVVVAHLYALSSQAVFAGPLPGNRHGHHRFLDPKIVYNPVMRQRGHLRAMPRRTHKLEQHWASEAVNG